MDLMGNLFRYYMTLDNVRTELIFAPIGWDEETIGSFKRDMTYIGIIRSYALPIQFTEDGAQILKYAFNKYGIEATVLFEVEERNDLWGYDLRFRSNFDFSKYNPVGSTVNIMLLETGIGKDIKAKEGFKYEFPLTGADVVNVRVPGVQFSEESIWITKYVDPSDFNIAKRFVIGTDLTTNGFGSTFVTALNTAQRNAADSDSFGGDAFVIGNRVGGITVRIRGTMQGFLRPSGVSPTRLHELIIGATTGGSGYNSIRQIYVGDSDTTNIVNFNRSFDFTYTLGYGEGLYIYSRADVSPSTSYLSVSEGEIYISYSTVSDPSNCKGIRAYDLWKRIMARVSPATVVGSVFLQSVRKDLIFTCGAAIREIADAKIKISLKDFFASIYGINDVGMGTDSGVFKLETANSFMRNIQIMDVGNVREFSQDNAEELLGNSVRVGYEDGNTDADNGREEYNSGQEWGLPITALQKELNWISPARADQYGIEQLRVQFNISKTATADNKSDNDTFMIDCNPIDGSGNFNPILGSQLTVVTGLSYPLTAYNLLLSPKHNLLNHEGYLRSILDRLDGRFIEFGSAEKNADLFVVASGVVVDEDRSISVSTLNGKYFQPYVFNITCKLPRNAMQLIDSNPFGYVTFNYNDTIASGYILELGVDLADNTEREIKLLATDFSLLP